MFFALNSSLINLFQSTLPTRGSDLIPPRDGSGGTQFQSTLPTRGSDQLTSNLISRFWQFQSTLPTRGSDFALQKAIHHYTSLFQSTLPTRGSDLWATPHGTAFQSTLPTRGSDFGSCHLFFLRENFNPRSPRGGATVDKMHTFELIEIFQSTLPTRGSDLFGAQGGLPSSLFQSTLPTRGSDDRKGGGLADNIGISIHAPHEGERRIFFFGSINSFLFQSTLPTRGSDKPYLSLLAASAYFNPRSPRGGATSMGKYAQHSNRISIHAPHEGERRWSWE